MELKALSARDDRELPPFWLAILPAILPIILIAARGGAYLDNRKKTPY
jgi:hypothetical protein